MKDLIKLKDRLEKIGINTEYVSNFPWVYIIEINGLPIYDKHGSDHGFVVGFKGIRTSDPDFKFSDLSSLFKLFRKYRELERSSVEYFEDELSGEPLTQESVIEGLRDFAILWQHIENVAEL